MIKIGNEVMLYLDLSGLTKFWDKIKTLLNNKLNKIEGGTSSLFLKADGSVDDTKYLPVTGGTIINGINQAPLMINTTNDVQVGQRFQMSGNHKAWIGYDINNGAHIHNYACSKVLGIKDDGTPHFHGAKIWCENNDGSGSGLNADILDGKQPADLSVGSAMVLNSSFTAVVTDMPQINTIIYKVHIPRTASGIFPVTSNGNSILTLSRHEGEFYSQIGFSSNDNLYYRSFSGKKIDTTTPWREVAFIDSNVASADKLATKQLTNEDLNDIKDQAFVQYYGVVTNTCLNKPDNVDNFTLQVFHSGLYVFVQILVDKFSNIFKRSCQSGNWTKWHRLIAEDDISELITTVNELKEKVTLLESKIE